MRISTFVFHAPYTIITWSVWFWAYDLPSSTWGILLVWTPLLILCVFTAPLYYKLVKRFLGEPTLMMTSDSGSMGFIDVAANYHIPIYFASLM